MRTPAGLKKKVSVMVNQRVKTVIEDLETTLCAFMRKHQISHSEYRAATDLIIQSIKLGEESLLFDVFFEAEASDISNNERQGSPEAIEGPFYLRGAPQLYPPYVMPQRDNEPGELLFFKGAITDLEGNPVPEAELDLWHADALGLYSNIHPGIPDWNLRGRFYANEQGQYEIQSILPPPYEIPKAGPTGAVLSALGRHCFRPAHLHVKVKHPAFGEMTSQLYFEGGEYLDNDVASAVRDGLVAKLVYRDSAEDLAIRGLTKPYYEVIYDFVLSAVPGKTATE
jgi:catechol 1,2-dioxygenase